MPFMLTIGPKGIPSESSKGTGQQSRFWNPLMEQVLLPCCGIIAGFEHRPSCVLDSVRLPTWPY